MWEQVEAVGMMQSSGDSVHNPTCVYITHAHIVCGWQWQQSTAFRCRSCGHLHHYWCSVISGQNSGHDQPAHAPCCAQACCCTLQAGMRVKLVKGVLPDAHSLLLSTHIAAALAWAMFRMLTWAVCSQGLLHMRTCDVNYMTL